MPRPPAKTPRFARPGVVPTCASASRRPTRSRRETAGLPIPLTINGKFVAIPFSSGELPLLWALRDHLGLKGTKFGCGQGGCGACLVHLDGLAVPSCITPEKEAAGKIIMTIREMPKVEVHIMPSGMDPSGAGEAGVPPIAPAVVNAVFAATGIRIRSLPLRPDDFQVHAGHSSLLY